MIIRQFTVIYPHYHQINFIFVSLIITMSEFIDGEDIVVTTRDAVSLPVSYYGKFTNIAS